MGYLAVQPGPAGQSGPHPRAGAWGVGQSPLKVLRTQSTQARGWDLKHQVGSWLWVPEASLYSPAPSLERQGCCLASLRRVPRLPRGAGRDPGTVAAGEWLAAHRACGRACTANEQLGGHLGTWPPGALHKGCPRFPREAPPCVPRSQVLCRQPPLSSVSHTPVSRPGVLRPGGGHTPRTTRPRLASHGATHQSLNFLVPVFSSVKWAENSPSPVAQPEVNEGVSTVSQFSPGVGLRLGPRVPADLLAWSLSAPLGSRAGLPGPGAPQALPQCRRGTWRAAPPASTAARTSPQAWDNSDPQGSKARFAPNTT